MDIPNIQYYVYCMIGVKTIFSLLHKKFYLDTVFLELLTVGNFHEQNFRVKNFHPLSRRTKNF